MPLATFALVLALLQVATTPSPPPQERPAAGTAVVRGRVIDKASGAPLVNAVVSLRNSRENSAQQKFTDDRGRFEFTAVPAGHYEVRATAGLYRATHVATNYQPPGSTSSVLTVLSGEERTDIDIALPRAVAISGRVTDEAGRPLAQVDVTVRPARGGPYGAMTRRRMTDDRGTFRVHGLPTGRYTICAEVRSDPRFEVQRRRPVRYLPTCHGDARLGTEVTVSEADVDGIEIRMPRRPTFVISGMVVTPAGPTPDNATIMLTHYVESGSRGVGVPLSATGVFTVSDVMPGNYEVTATLGRGSPSPQADARDPQWGALKFEVTTADVEGLVIVMKPAVTVKGRVIFEDPPPSAATPIRVTADADVRGFDRRMNSAITVAEDGSFELTNLFGPVVVRVEGAAPRGYVLKSVRFAGRDIQDIPTEFDGNPAHDLQVVFTSRTAELAGRVLDETGTEVQATVLRFPAHAARWKQLPGFPIGAPARNGTYRLSQLPAGEYCVIAVPQASTRELRFPEDYERLAAVAERITLLENDRRIGDLRLTPIPSRTKDR
jgi:5-hydroxyisourate hydrolase-like protein (transthyretin family)